MQLIDVLLWLLAIVFLFGNPIGGLIYIALLLYLYKKSNDKKKQDEANKKHNELVNAIKNRREDN